MLKETAGELQKQDHQCCKAVHAPRSEKGASQQGEGHGGGWGGGDGGSDAGGHEPGAQVCGQETRIRLKDALPRRLLLLQPSRAWTRLCGRIFLTWSSDPGLSTFRNSLTDTEGVSGQLSLHPSAQSTPSISHHPALLI